MFYFLQLASQSAGAVSPVSLISVVLDIHNNDFHGRLYISHCHDHAYVCACVARAG